MYSSKNLNTAVYLLSECEQFYDSDENAVKVFDLCVEYLYTKKVSKLKKALGKQPGFLNFGNRV